MVKDSDHHLKALLSRNKSSCRSRRNYKTSGIDKPVMAADRSLQTSFSKTKKTHNLNIILHMVALH